MKRRYRTMRQKRFVEYDEILLDASNLPAFNSGRLEGRIELPIPQRNVWLVGILFLLIAGLFLTRLFSLQVLNGEEFAAISERNRVGDSVVIAPRGVVYDRNNELLIWNEPSDSAQRDFPVRAYTDRAGLGQLLGYVSYPQTDSTGIYYRTEYLGRNGIEAAYNETLTGQNGSRIVETDARGEPVSAHEVEPSRPGDEIQLSVDAEFSEAFYQIIATSSAQAGFTSGAGVVMDVTTGEIVALTSFPSYDPEVMADGANASLIDAYTSDSRKPFLNKVIAGEYTPGSVVKPFVAYAALAEDVIDPEATIVSTGELTIPNPYNPEAPSRFTDWRAHGEMTMSEALAFSSNIYFYIIGGGLPEIALPQAGLEQPLSGVGITDLAQYFRRFGFGTTTGVRLGNEQAGVVPDPAWKQATFADDWRLGDTYLTAIGQFGWQTTPLQLVRAYAALGNGGRFFTPHVQLDTVGDSTYRPLSDEHLNVVHTGMRMTTNYPGGTARGLEKEYVAIAAKSGTAELGAGNAFVNSWAAGFWPYEEPRYAFVLLMHEAPRDNTLGATTIMGDVFDWMHEHRPDYIDPPADARLSTD